MQDRALDARESRSRQSDGRSYGGLGGLSQGQRRRAKRSYDQTHSHPNESVSKRVELQLVSNEPSIEEEAALFERTRGAKSYPSRS